MKSCDRGGKPKKVRVSSLELFVAPPHGGASQHSLAGLPTHTPHTQMLVCSLVKMPNAYFFVLKNRLKQWQFWSKSLLKQTQNLQRLDIFLHKKCLLYANNMQKFLQKTVTILQNKNITKMQQNGVFLYDYLSNICS